MAKATTATRQQEPGNPLARFDRIYDLYRSCILNELYYGRRLNLFTRSGLWLDIVIIIGSGTSGVAGWIIWTKYPALAALWAVIAAASTLLAALKPVLHTDAKIKRYSSLFSAYRQLAISMKMVVDDIGETRAIPREIEREIDRIRARYSTLSVDDDPRPSPKVVERLQAEVNRRVPTSTLFYPSSNFGPSAPIAPTAPAPPSVAGDVDGVDTKINPIDPWPRGKGRRR
jgi:hypothetical protein